MSSAPVTRCSIAVKDPRQASAIASQNDAGPSSATGTFMEVMSRSWYIEGYSRRRNLIGDSACSERVTVRFFGRIGLPHSIQRNGPSRVSYHRVHEGSDRGIV